MNFCEDALDETFASGSEDALDETFASGSFEQK
jgi:hypothetical protein